MWPDTLGDVRGLQVKGHITWQSTEEGEETRCKQYPRLGEEEEMEPAEKMEGKRPIRPGGRNSGALVSSGKEGTLQPAKSGNRPELQGDLRLGQLWAES